jgi:hypothetical protein
VNASTAEHAWDAIVSYPLTQLFDWKVERLIDFGYVYDKAVERLQWPPNRSLAYCGVRATW